MGGRVKCTVGVRGENFQAHLTSNVLFRLFTSVSRCFSISEGRSQKCQAASHAYKTQKNVKEIDLPFLKQTNVWPTLKCRVVALKQQACWGCYCSAYLGRRYFEISNTSTIIRLISLSPAVFVLPSSLAVIPRASLHSSSNFSSSSLWPSFGS